MHRSFKGCKGDVPRDLADNMNDDIVGLFRSGGISILNAAERLFGGGTVPRSAGLYIQVRGSGGGAERKDRAKGGDQKRCQNKGKQFLHIMYLFIFIQNKVLFIIIYHTERPF